MFDIESLLKLSEVLNSFFNDDPHTSFNDIKEIIDDIAFSTDSSDRAVTHRLKLELDEDYALEFIGTKKRLKFIASCMCENVLIAHIESVDPEEHKKASVFLSHYKGFNENLDIIYELIDNA